MSPAVLFFPVEREFNFADSGILPTVDPVLKIQIWTLNPFFNLGSISPELSSTCDRSDFVDLSFLKVVIQFSKFSIQQIRICGKTFLSCWKNAGLHQVHPITEHLQVIHSIRRPANMNKHVGHK